MTMHSDFNRDVHCLLGLPFDALSLPSAVQRIRSAAATRSPCFLSTPNLNFLIAAQSDSAFRRSVINSNLSVADGMPLIWMARLLGMPIRQRVAGSDIFERLRADSGTRLSVYFFGGMQGVAEMACKRLNAAQSGVVCTGFEYPGFGSVRDMSRDEIIENINTSGADFLLVSLGAKKGQAWIERNRSRISVPVISHLGAVVNFVAGSVSRAPVWMQRCGLEWLWRIKEEPGLWQRYAADGRLLLKLLLTRVIPHAWYMYRHKALARELANAAIDLSDDGGEIVIRMGGTWVEANLQPLRACFAGTAPEGRNVKIDMQHVTYVDSACIGILLLLYGDLLQQGQRLSVVHLQHDVRRIFRYVCAEYLLDAHA
jgi:N-acetylglucosaminyldiphosphoundecaprenol N-acetyl-beta-D-mannosaminyltransferase